MTQSALPQSFQLVNRSSVVTVGPVQVSNIGQQIGLRAWFQVRRSLKPGEPNTCDLRLYNLSDDTRKAIEQAAQPIAPPGGGAPGADTTATPVKIVAGYVGASATVFLGELRSAQTIKTEEGDTVTELTTGDGDSAAILARAPGKCFGAGANAYQVAQYLLAQMGCGVGNIATVRSILTSAPCYQRGVVLKGRAYELLRDLALSCGLEVTVQGGVAQWLSQGEPLGGQAYVLSTTPTNTGVVGSPTVDTKGVLSLKTLLLPGLAPGAPIVVKTTYISGLYRITSIETTGDTRAGDWYHAIEAKRIGLAP